MKTGLYLDPTCLHHEPGEGHPESPDRYRAVADRLASDGLTDETEALETRDVTDEQVLRCHTREYLELAKREVAAGASSLSTGDTALSAGSMEAARRAAGGAVAAVDAVCSGKVGRAFCAVRPPGHHATPSRGMGFCLFNSIGIAARHAQAEHGIRRVAIIDWDVHHGNGTQDIFYDDPSVYFFSTHQSPWYPGTGAASETGAGDAGGTTLNVPLAAGSGMREVGGAFEKQFLPAMEEFEPDLVLVSAGFDSRKGDPLGQLTLGDPDFGELTGLLLDLAQRRCGGKLVALLEGGYNLSGLASATSAHVGKLVEGK